MEESDRRSSVEGSVNRRLSNLHLDLMPTASSTYRVDFADRHSPSSTYSPPRQPAGSDAGFHSPISQVRVSDSCQKDSSRPRRLLSLDCTRRKPIPPEVLNQIRRVLFNSPVSGSGTTAAFLPARETTPVPITDLNPLARTASHPTRLTSSIFPNSTQESPSFKRLKRLDSAKEISQQMDGIKNWINQMVKEDSAVNNFPSSAETEIQAEKTVNNTNEAPLQEQFWIRRRKRMRTWS